MTKTKKVNCIKTMNKTKYDAKTKKIKQSEKVDCTKTMETIKQVKEAVLSGDKTKKVNCAKTTEKTKQVKKAVLSGDILKEAIYQKYKDILKEEYDRREKEFFNQEWIAFFCYGYEGYWNKSEQIAIPVQDNYDSLLGISFGNRVNVNLDTAKALFGRNCPNEIKKGILASYSYDKYHYIGFIGGSYCIENGNTVDWNDGDSIKVETYSKNYTDFKKAILSQEYKILTDDVFKKAVALLKKRSVYELEEKEIDKLINIFGFDKEKITEEAKKRIMNNFVLSENENCIKILLSCDKNRADLEKYDKKCLEDVNSGHWELWYNDEPTAKEGQVVATFDKPLVARNPAADIHEDGLIGIDFGTKSTIVSKQDGREKTTLLRVGIGQLAKAVKSYHYENPTIMEFRDLEKFLYDYTQKIGRPETSINDLRVSHAADNDLKSCGVSNEFYSYFYDIKQWCGDTERNIKIIDQKGVERVLPAFVKLEDNEFNPLELYAYYLGIYINNMRNGIYLDYILSFPVTYERAVKEKILESFTKGLRKSLPETILNNDDIMSKFRVEQGVSEPAAYAITALLGYGFDPKEGENILYAIFDFGGGTTDFDFGLWRISDESKRDEELYDYVIEHFGSEGDKYLGGENLLELMAFEIFKANAKFLGRTKKNDAEDDDKVSAGFSFSKPKECDEFPGSETLISNSQEAKRNTKQLMEALRPFWEGIIGIEGEDNNYVESNKNKNENNSAESNKNKNKNKNKDKNNFVESNVYNRDSTTTYRGYIFKNTEDCKFPIDNGIITVDLFDKDGNRKQRQPLYIENREENIDVNLIDILEKRIERGVSNFFQSIILAFRNESAVKSKAESIQIFLAGNSSKSPILRKVFNKYIEKANSEAEQKLDGGYYHLFPPLGTKEAVKIQREKGINVNENDVSAPTGKTGVAYGLITGREGGKIKVISEIKADKQTKFRYNIGIAKHGKFSIKLDRNKVSYGQWTRLINAGVKNFEIYYTSLPSAGKMAIDETGIYKKRCRLSEVDENADIYIRTVEDAPEDIEYCVSTSEQPPEDVQITRIHLGE